LNLDSFSVSLLFLSDSLISFAHKYEIHGFIVKAIAIEISNAQIANFGIGFIYSHIIPVTANIEPNAKSLVRVARITHTHTS